MRPVIEDLPDAKPRVPRHLRNGRPRIATIIVMGRPLLAYETSDFKALELKFIEVKADVVIVCSSALRGTQRWRQRCRELETRPSRAEKSLQANQAELTHARFWSHESCRRGRPRHCRHPSGRPG